MVSTYLKSLCSLALLLPLGFCQTMSMGGSLCPVGPFLTDPGATERWTRFEKEQLVALNSSGEKVCGWTAPAR
jgi:hypothetical protein